MKDLRGDGVTTFFNIILITTNHPMILTKIAMRQSALFSINYLFSAAKGPVPRRFRNRQKPREELFTK